MQIKVLASGSKGNAYYISDGQTQLLIECGLQWQKLLGMFQGLDYLPGMTDLGGCLVSHEHMDHAKSAAKLLARSLDVYASAGTIEALGLTGHRVHVLAPTETVGIGTWRVLSFPIEHDAAEPLGFLLQSGQEKLLYATDTAYLKFRFQGLTRIMVECNYDSQILNDNVARGALPLAMKKRVLKSHFSLDNVKQFLMANDLSLVQEIWLLHLSDGNADAVKFKAEIEQLIGKVVRTP